MRWRRLAEEEDDWQQQYPIAEHEFGEGPRVGCGRTDRGRDLPFCSVMQ